MSEPEFHMMSDADKVKLLKGIVGVLLGLMPDKLGRLITCFARLQCDDYHTQWERNSDLLTHYLDNLKDGPEKALQACEHRAKQMAEGTI